MGIARGRIIAVAAVALISLTAIPVQADAEVDDSGSTAAGEAVSVTVPVRTMGGSRALIGA